MREIKSRGKAIMSTEELELMKERQITLTDLRSNIKQEVQTIMDAFYQVFNQLVLPRAAEQLVKRYNLSLELLALEKELQRTQQLLKYTKHSKKREKHLKRINKIQQRLNELNKHSLKA